MHRQSGPVNNHASGTRRIQMIAPDDFIMMHLSQDTGAAMNNANGNGTNGHGPNGMNGHGTNGKDRFGPSNRKTKHQRNLKKGLKQQYVYMEIKTFEELHDYAVAGAEAEGANITDEDMKHFLGMLLEAGIAAWRRSEVEHLAADPFDTALNNAWQRTRNGKYDGTHTFRNHEDGSCTVEFSDGTKHEWSAEDCKGIQESLETRGFAISPAFIDGKRLNN